MANELKKQDIIVKNDEGSPWFWKIFGGAIVSMISILLVIVIGHITTTLNQNAIESRESVKRLWQENVILREKASANEQMIQSLKEKNIAIETILKERCIVDKEHEKQIFDLKESIIKLKIN